MNDVIVVGAGVIGLMTARELHRAGANVHILERGTVHGGASWAGGGVLAPMDPWSQPDAVWRLVAWSRGQYPRLAAELNRETGIDVECVQSGLLILDAGDAAGAREWAFMRRVPLEILDPPAVSECEPAAAVPQRHALFLPDVAQIRNPRFLKALKAAVQAEGVTVYEHTDVTGLRLEDRAVRAVETAGGDFRADSVVIAAGAWSGRLLAGTGLETRIEPVRGQMVLMQTEPGTLTRIVRRGDHYVVPRRDGWVLAGSTVEYVGYDDATTDEAVEALRVAAGGLVPALADARVERAWAALRPGTRDGVPLVGPHPHLKGVYLNCGHFRNGIATAPASARLLTDQLMGRPNVIDPGAYRPC